MELASIRTTLAFPDASSQIRRLFGPRGRAAKQDVLAAAALDAAWDEGDFEA